MSYPVCIVRQSGPKKVDFLDAQGYHLKQQLFLDEVVSCSVNGGTIAVSLANGKTEIYEARNGSYLRSV